ncbi:hypothetical protein ACU686_01035 [Yinghuangia aomiensis]
MLAGAQLMIVLDATIVNIALKHIKTALDFNDASLTWGDERLHADLRRFAAARRAPRRPARPPGLMFILGAGHGTHAGQPARRVRAERSHAAGRPCPAGRRRKRSPPPRCCRWSPRPGRDA